MALLPRLVGVLLFATVVAGLDCDAARRAVVASCDAFGAGSHPCHMVRMYNTAHCDIELGESDDLLAAPAKPATAAAPAKKAEAATVEKKVETKVEKKVEKKVQPAAALAKKAKAAPAAPAKKAPAAPVAPAKKAPAAPAAPAKAAPAASAKPVKKAAPAPAAAAAPAARVNPKAANGLVKALKDEEKAASTGDIQETIRLANVVYAKAQKMCQCHFNKESCRCPCPCSVCGGEKAEAATKAAEVKAEAPKVVAAQAKADAKAATVAKPGSSLQKLEKEGVVNPKAAKTANKLSLDTAKEFAKEVKKKEAGSLADPMKTLKSEKKEAEKAEVEQAKVKKKADLAAAKQKTDKAASKAMAEGKDPKPIVKKIMAAADKKAMKDEAKGAVKAPAAVIKLGVKDVKKKQDDVERENVAKMTKALPKGVGLQRAFEKIEEQKVTALKKEEQRKVEKAAVKEMEGVVTAGRKGLSEGAKEALIAQEKKQSEENAEKVKPNDAAAKKLEKEEEKIEDTKSPAKAGDKVMFGKSENELAKEALTTNQKTVSKAAKAKDDKDAKRAEAEKKTEEGTGGAEVEML